MKGFSKTELTGLILLAILIILILTASFSLRGCSDEASSSAPPLEIVAVDTADVPVPTVEIKQKKKKSKNKKKKTAKKGSAPFSRPDPFKDTVPTY